MQLKKVFDIYLWNEEGVKVGIVLFYFGFLRKH